MGLQSRASDANDACHSPSILSQEDPVMETLLQLKPVRICEPGRGEKIKTNYGARSFVPVRLLDFTGVANLRM